jgi:hypothetical protein
METEGVVEFHQNSWHTQSADQIRSDQISTEWSNRACWKYTIRDSKWCGHVGDWKFQNCRNGQLFTSAIWQYMATFVPNKNHPLINTTVEVFWLWAREAVTRSPWAFIKRLCLVSTISEKHCFHAWMYKKKKLTTYVCCISSISDESIRSTGSRGAGVDFMRSPNRFVIPGTSLVQTMSHFFEFIFKQPFCQLMH